MSSKKLMMSLVVLMALVLATLSGSWSTQANQVSQSLGRPGSCLQNPPPQGTFDLDCLAKCAAEFPNNAEARCQCSLGCIRPID